MTAEEYHADPCPEPSLSSGIAKLLIRRSPLHAHAAHPRFGAAERDATKAMDAGSILHRMILGAGGDYEAVEADDWRIKAAKDARDEIRAAGRTPVLARELDGLRDAAEAALAQMRQHPDLEAFFAPGTSEAVITWREGETWFRCMVDRLPANKRAPWFDIKTTGMSAAPVDFQRAMMRDHAFQGAFYRRPAAALGYAPAPFLFVVVEQKPPHAVSVMTAASSLRIIAENEVERAVNLWGQCMRTGEWPGYAQTTAHVEAPAWALAAEEAEMMEEAA